MVGVLFSSLSGCGFQLRGMDSLGQLQFKTVFVQNELQARVEVQQALRKQLALSGVQKLDSEHEAEVIIRLQPTGYHVSRTAYSGQGDATAELLKMSLSFTAIWGLTGNVLVTGTTEVYRDRQIETAALLASEQELVDMRQSMAEALARQMMDRINRAVQKRFALEEPATDSPKPVHLK
jgi:LPS-assembly lipoprotein